LALTWPELGAGTLLVLTVPASEAGDYYPHPVSASNPTRAHARAVSDLVCPAFGANAFGPSLRLFAERDHESEAIAIHPGPLGRHRLLGWMRDKATGSVGSSASGICRGYGKRMCL